MTAGAPVHATAWVIGETGILVRGQAQSGKTTLATASIAAATARGQFAALVADDQVHLAPTDGRLVASAPEALAGRVESYGLGIRSVPYLKAAVVDLVADLAPADDLDRYPADADDRVTIAGIVLRHLALPARSHSLALRTLEAILFTQPDE